MKELEMGIGRRLAIGFGSILFLLLASLGICLLGNYHQSQGTDRLGDVIMPRMDAANDLEIAYLYQSAGARSYVLTGEDRWLTDYRRGLDQASDAISRLDKLPKSAEGTALFNEMGSLAARFTQSADRAVAFRQQGRLEEARQILESEMFPVREQLLARSEAFMDVQYRFSDEARADLRRVQGESIRNSVAVGLLALIVGAFLAQRTASSVRNPVRALVKASQHLAGGDYASAMELAGGVAGTKAESQDEVRQLATRLRLAAQELFERESRLRTQSEEIQAQNEQLQVQNDELETQRQKLVELSQALSESEEQQRHWVAIISHDLRSPLTVIQGQAQILQRYAETPEAVRKGAEAVFTGVRRMNTMIQDMVDSARLEAGELRLDVAPLDLAAYLYDLADRWKGVAGNERLQLDLSEHRLPPVLADPNRIERVFTNLVTNALKYSDGRVTLRAERQGNNVAVSVIDQGRGIPKEDQKRIFERFYRASNREGREGLGLGLYISRLLVEAHGGKIRVESEEDKGSTFIVELPSAGPSLRTVMPEDR